MAVTYIETLQLLSEAEEYDFFLHLRRRHYQGCYPYRIFPQKGLSELSFAPITIFYGGNGSGKTTLLNIIAEKTKILRHSAFGGSAFFAGYVDECELDGRAVPEHSQMLTSDDVFDYLLNIRYLNDGIDVRSEELFEEYLDRKYAKHQLKSLAEYEDWKESYEAQTQSGARFIRNRLMRNVDMFSNGQSAMKYFVDHITENALYLLDEPENSLAIDLQLGLGKYIEDSARHFGCQFVISTHSPVLLALKDALIYDLDADPVITKPWTELENVRRYFDFFESHREEFVRPKIN